MFHNKGKTGPGCHREIDGTVTLEPSHVPQGLAEWMNLAERAGETSCKHYELRQILSKLPKDLPGKNGPF